MIDQIKASEERLTALIKTEVQASEGRLTKRINDLEADIKKILSHLGID